MFPFHHVLALLVGFLVDLAIGDPYRLPHPVRWIGRLIAALERPIRAVFPKNRTGERRGGAVLVVLVIGVTLGAAALLLWLCRRVGPWLCFAVECLICYQMLATKQLKVESMRVHDALVGGTLEDARRAVSMIVGRDTAELDEEGVAKAAVETVAENASDGVVAPLLFMGIFGPLGGVFYKAANTMDSMIGYKNERYRDFGTVAAKLDDVLNFIPARVSGALMCLASPLVGLDGKGAWRIFKRDRKKHASPNSAHTEAACAGALGVELAGGASYFGVYHEKPTIGDATRPIEAEDIVSANRLMYATAGLALVVALALGAIVAFV